MENLSCSGQEGLLLRLRDRLAISRTMLANERTFLAYLRMGIALVIAGLTIMNFAQQQWFWTVGVCCIPAGVLAGIVGVLRYRKMQESISRMNTAAGDASDHC